MTYFNKLAIAILPTGLTLVNFVAFIILGIFGIIFSLIHEVYRKRVRIKNEGGFKFTKLWNDNQIRIIFSICAVIISIILGEEFGLIVNKGFVFLAGFGTDKFVETLSMDKLRNKNGTS